MTDFSKPETRELYEQEVRKRQDLGMSREQAEMLVAVLMWDAPVTLPPRPWSTVESGYSDHRGQVHIYLIDANGKKIAAIWGTGEAKLATAQFILDRCNG